jgi:predicted RNase H-like nuclease (RuvC/YqgF family)
MSLQDDFDVFKQHIMETISHAIAQLGESPTSEAFTATANIVFDVLPQISSRHQQALQAIEEAKMERVAASKLHSDHQAKLASFDAIARENKELRAKLATFDETSREIINLKERIKDQSVVIDAARSEAERNEAEIDAGNKQIAALEKQSMKQTEKIKHLEKQQHSTLRLSTSSWCP